MAYTFQGCSALKTAPVIPQSVKNITAIFDDCTELTGVVTINANPTEGYEDAFYGTEKPIILKGSSSLLNEIATTTSEVPSNVTVE